MRVKLRVEKKKKKKGRKEGKVLVYIWSIYFFDYLSVCIIILGGCCKIGVLGKILLKFCRNE